MLCDALHEASHFMQRDFCEITQLQNSRKGTSDFVNKCYTRIQNKLVKSLTEKRPNYKIILPNEAKPNNSELFIVIEPIAGIKNFQHSIPFCAIAAALFQKNSEHAVAMAVHNPILRETFYTAKGLGAWFENYNEALAPKSRMRVSAQNNIKEALISTEIKHEHTINLGCTLLEIIYCSAARIDLVIKKQQNLIDSAASLFIKEAGGYIHIENNILIASNEALTKQAAQSLIES